MVISAVVSKPSKQVERRVDDEGTAYAKKRAPQTVTDGISSKTLSVQLAPNALVRALSVKVRADYGNVALVANVAQTRQQPSGITRLFKLVVDFGTPRTVAAVGSGSEDTSIFTVTAWTGAAFADKAVYAATWAESAKSGEIVDIVKGPAGSTAQNAVLPTEIRTEKLLIDLITTETDVVELSQQVWVQLPDAPADLELRIDGGPPVWRSPGVVQPGVPPWDDDASQVVDVTKAFDTLTHDPTGSDAVKTFLLVLGSRVPGALDLTIASRQVSFLQRMDVGPDAKRELVFDAEGAQRVTLSVRDSTRTIEEVTLIAAGSLPPERAVPPLGPDIVTQIEGAPVDSGAVELRLDPDHSVCVQPSPGNLGELTAVRLPLVAEAGGAEVRVVLLPARNDGEPGAPAGASSRSVTLEPPTPTDDADPWSTFAFARPVPLAAAAPPPWVQVVVVRGAVRWKLGQFGAAQATLPVETPPYPVKRGPTSGPWVPLPALVGPDRGIGGRARLVGHARKGTTIPPITLQLAGSRAGLALGVTPTAKGAPFTLPAGEGPAMGPTGSTGHKSVDLVVVSSVAGTVTLRNIDVTGGK
jgi:hypothetical protein